MASLLVEADFRDLERLEMLVLELRNDLKSALVPGGSYFASLRAGGRLSEAIGQEERWKGVSQLVRLRRYAGRSWRAWPASWSGCARRWSPATASP